VIAAINQADLSKQEKNEAKSLLQKLLGSKAAASVLGAARNPRRESISRDRAESRRQRFVGSLPSRRFAAKNGQSFGKYAQSALTDEVNYKVSGQEKQKN
jgi:hypothetical protein